VCAAALCPGGHVYSFEPAPESRRYLEQNLAASGAGNVTVVAAALYDRDGDIGFDYNPANPGGSHIGAGELVTVQAVRPDRGAPASWPGATTGAGRRRSRTWWPTRPSPSGPPSPGSPADRAMRSRSAWS